MDSTKDIRDVGVIVKELMGGSEEGVNASPDNPKRWHNDAISFLGETTSALSASELLKVFSMHNCLPFQTAD